MTDIDVGGVGADVDTRTQSSSIEGRYARVTNIRAANADTVRYTTGDVYDYVTLGDDCRLVEHNSVLLIPDLLSAAECDTLMRDADAEHQRVIDALPESARGDVRGLERYMVSELSADTQALFEVLLRERLLSFVSRELPLVEEMVWGQSMVEQWSSGLLCDQRYRFSAQEPAINRYSVGGLFEPHRDTLALTLNVLLRVGSFKGGGTQFWAEGEDEADSVARAHDPTLCIEPTVAGVGIVFNGKVKHAGRVVTEGLRHLLVASFSIVPQRAGCRVLL
eukprot:TRINITY_DN17442_c0_g1_i1.p1 TRINITY_DN17442_c0_g1~~TRINITY_DN17442_c0_g1_i1.p1  ORF type:complete len:278 (-),score=41.77 TRINITY_DN17442_c0_g1_i1:283-1116(-)